MTVIGVDRRGCAASSGRYDCRRRREPSSVPALAMCVWTMSGRTSRQDVDQLRQGEGVVERREFERRSAA